MAEIIVGKYARKHPRCLTIVDDEDFEMLDQYNWHIHQAPSKGPPHVSRNIPPPEGMGPGSAIKMHNQLMSPERGMMVVHLNGNTLDNRKENLRVVKRTSIMLPGGKRKRRSTRSKRFSSKYWGVSLHKKTQIWRAYVYVDCKQRYLGSFRDEKEAARAYDAASKEMYGDNALLNFPGE